MTESVRGNEPQSNLWSGGLNFLCLFALAYGVWHGLTSYITAYSSDLAWLPRVPPSAIINFTVFLIYAALLGVGLRSSFAKSPMRFSELFICLWPCLALLNMRGRPDAPALVDFYNSVFLALLLLGILRRRDVGAYFGKVFQWAFPILLVSYLLALALPYVLFKKSQMIDLGILKPDGEIFRLGGVGRGPEILGFGGAILAIWAGTELYLGWGRVMNGWRSGLRWFAMLLGILGIQYSVHRTSLLALLGFLFMAAWICRGDPKKRPLYAGFAAVFLLTLASGFSPLMLGKNRFFSSVEVTAPVVSTSDVFETTQGIVNTNGRNHLWRFLLGQVRRVPWLGLGTGGAPRSLRTNGYTGEPHSDYLRVVSNHGFVGLALFLTIGALMWLELKGSFARAVIFALGLGYVSDNLMVYPTFGYGPMLLSAVLLFREHSSVSVKEKSPSPAPSLEKAAPLGPTTGFLP